MEQMGSDSWLAANQRTLVAEIHRISELLLRDSEPIGKKRESPELLSLSGAPDIHKPDTNAADTLHPSALDILCHRFNLSPFERDILLLCAGIDLDSSFAALCASAHSYTAHSYPTFSLALAALPNPRARPFPCRRSAHPSSPCCRSRPTAPSRAAAHCVW